MLITGKKEKEERKKRIEEGREEERAQEKESGRVGARWGAADKGAKGKG